MPILPVDIVATHRVSPSKRSGTTLCAVFVTLLFLSMASRGQTNPALSEVFQNALACALIEPLLANGKPAALYSLEATNCVSVVPNDDPDAGYYLDENCTHSINFSPTPLLQYCESLIDPSLLGEGEGIVSGQWSLSPGTLLDIGARSLDGVSQPYVQRIIYRNIATSRGECQLEMRIYSPQPGVAHQGSLLAFHGGSWSARGFGFFGLELTVPHFVEQGFVVFAPFYRLLGDDEGSDACNNASINEIVDDAEAALDWVRENAEAYGGSVKPVVFGQSAGAHLALSLTVNQSESLIAGVLLYPPTDFTDFVLRVRSGEYANAQGLGILNRILGVSATQADLNASPVPENSFPLRIVESGLSIPPLFIIHGIEDELVEARQSIRLCDALAGRNLLATHAPVPTLNALRETLTCGEHSSLQLIKEGRHALDVCLADIQISNELCPSGSSESRQEVSYAIAEAVEFAHRAINAQVQATIVSTRSGATVGLFIVGLSAVLILRFVTNSRTGRRRMRAAQL